MNQDDLAAVERILEEDPDSLAFARLASMYLEQGDTERAKAICLQGIETHPFYANGYIVLAKCHRAEGTVQEARRGLKQVLRLDPDSLAAFWELSRINEEEGRTSLVVRNLTRILQREPLNDTVRDELVRLGEDIATDDTAEMEPLISETTSIEEAIEEMVEDVDILAADEEEHASSLLPGEEATGREAGWELLDQIQEELTQETEAVPAVTDEIESMLGQETLETSEGIETESIPAELSELLFGDQDQPEPETSVEQPSDPIPDHSSPEETAPSSEEQDDELAQLLQSIETQSTPQAEEEDQEQPEQEAPVEELSVDEIESMLEPETSVEQPSDPIPDHPSLEETAPSSEGQDDQLAQLLQNIESTPQVAEEEGGEDSEDVDTSVQSSLNEILGSLGGTDIEEPAEQSVEDVEVPPADLPRTEEAPVASSEETAASASESDELLSLLGQISDQQEAGIQDEGDIREPAEESSETASREDLPAEPTEESQLPLGRKAIPSSGNSDLLSLLGQISDQQEPQIQHEQGTEGRSEDPIVTATLADIYANQGMVDKAIQILEEALKTRPDDLHIQNRLKEIRKSVEGTRGRRTDSSTKEE